MSRILRILLQNFSHSQWLGTVVKDGTSTARHISDKHSYHLSRRWYSGSSDPWDPRVRLSKNDNDDMTRPPTSSPMQSKESRLIYDDQDHNDFCTPVGTQTEDVYTIDKKEYRSDHKISTDQDIEDLDLSDNSQNYLLPSQKEKQHSDLLLRKIRECQMSEEVFTLQHKHKEVMGIHHIIIAMERLAEFVSQGTENDAEIRNKDDFREIGQRLFEFSRRLDADEVTTTLKHLCRLNVPADSKLVQTILQMLRHLINELDLKRLVFIEFLLKKMWPKTALSEALLTALPLLLDTRLNKHELGDLSIHALSMLFSIGVKGRSKNGGLLVQELWNRHNEIQNTFLAKNIAWSLLDLTTTLHKRNLLSSQEKIDRNKLLRLCLENIAQSPHSIPHNQLDMFFTRLTNAYVHRDRSCYHEFFLQSVVEQALKQGLNFKEIAKTIDKLQSMGFQSDELVQQLVSQVVSYPEGPGEADLSLLPLLDSLAACTLPIPHLQQFLNILMTNWDATLIEESVHHKPLLKIALNLLSLKHLHPKLMDILTNPDTLSMYMSQYDHTSRNQMRLLEIDQAMRMVFDIPQGIPDMFLATGQQQMMEKAPSRSNLNSMLHKVLDSNCFISGVISEEDIYLDHLLVLDSAGHPIPMTPPAAQSQQNIRIDSLALPPDCTRLAILDVGSGRTYRPAHQLHGVTRLQRQVLEAEGFRVLLFLQAAFYATPAEEKLLYVARELRRAGVILDNAPRMVTISTNTEPQAIT